MYLCTYLSQRDHRYDADFIVRSIKSDGRSAHAYGLCMMLRIPVGGKEKEVYSRANAVFIRFRYR